jgi:hypothetical protein
MKVELIGYVLNKYRASTAVIWCAQLMTDVYICLSNRNN